MNSVDVRGIGTSTALMGSVINLVCTSHTSVAYVVYPTKRLASVFESKMHGALRALGICNPEQRVRCYGEEVPRGVNFVGTNNVLFFDRS